MNQEIRMKIHHINFTGAILERGFWLYVWRIQSGVQVFFYVGRTGDSSSRFAASPFSRLSQHLDVRHKAKANMLLRHIREMGLDPLACKFDLIALGPLFPEQSTLEFHRKFRDRIAPLEAALSTHLRSKDLTVVGKHSSNTSADPRLLAKVKSLFDKTLLSLVVGKRHKSG